MKRLLQIEWLKFKENGFMRMLVLVFVVFFVSLVPIIKQSLGDLPKPFPKPDMIVEFPTIWEYQGYLGNWLVSLCLAFMVIYSITSEVTNKTMRQNIITGFTRKEYFLSKLYSTILFATVATVLYYISSIIIGMIYTDGYDMELIFDNNWAALRFFVMSMGYLSFAMLIAFLIRRGFLALLIYFVYVMMIEQIIRLVHLGYAGKTKAACYYPMNTIEDLFPIPMVRTVGGLANSDFSVVLTQTQALVGSCIYTLVFLGLAYYLFARKDV